MVDMDMKLYRKKHAGASITQRGPRLHLSHPTSPLMTQVGGFEGRRSCETMAFERRRRNPAYGPLLGS